MTAVAATPSTRPTAAPAPASGARTTPAASRATAVDTSIVGADVRIPLVTGERVTYANFDYAASAPCLAAVREVLDASLPYYASVHRGAGFHSQVSTNAYEQARRSVARFVGARHNDAVVFVRGTTDALNLLARSVPKDCTVVVFAAEHHASLLPWQHRGSRAGKVIRLPLPQSPDAAVEAAREALRSAPEGPRLLCVTGASNVTGEIWPIERLTAVAHSAGARIVVDAAQLIPHQSFGLSATGADYVAFSGHKLYAPFGAGVLAGRTDWLQAATPYLAGGGATGNVTEDDVRWNDLPARHEAGSPNVLGAVTLAAACDTLTEAGQDELHAREQALLDRLRTGLAAIPGVRDLALWDTDHPRVGIVSFVIDGLASDLVAAALSAEYGIGVRDGLFCAHLLTRHLLPEEHEQAVRASIGLGTTEEHVDRLIGAVARLAAHGPRWEYRDDNGRIAPLPDPRPLR
ncbi:aminotransferase class V-fold PLP-dependent enzyme [Nocardiopsis gilva YIM 90087]|uniref:Aminotransferase class V-fold PLP-dependent enzyme n=2 Tax=Nocardiopsis gilva TaxID=280236 RepID=A0A223S5H8_9ACTN|nr:aminotransferase class V-fold PLP-dependent enzyme [Nocardiopsis gilva]ASU83386.1 aminotransferase class V-fold PLP-dependent enzyme [Nocardiopsis gilva YIM 90087]